VLPYFRKSEGLAPSDEMMIDMLRRTIAPARWASPCVRRSSRAPGNSLRRPRLPASHAVTTTDATGTAGVVSQDIYETVYLVCAFTQAVLSPRIRKS